VLHVTYIELHAALNRGSKCFSSPIHLCLLTRLKQQRTTTTVASLLEIENESVGSQSSACLYVYAPLGRKGAFLVRCTYCRRDVSEVEASRQCTPPRRYYWYVDEYLRYRYIRATMMVRNYNGFSTLPSYAKELSCGDVSRRDVSEVEASQQCTPPRRY
jgi:hypothetical protein